MTDNDVLVVKIDVVAQDLKDLKGELAELRKDLKPALEMLARHDERITSLSGWRNGMVASIVAVGLAAFRQKFGL